MSLPGTGTVTINGTALENVTWSNGVITGDVPMGTLPGKYQLMVTRDNGLSTVMGVTVVVGPIAGNVLEVAPSANPSATPIQDAIDLALPGDLILVAPGEYEEMVILWKDVQLQDSQIIIGVSLRYFGLVRCAPCQFSTNIGTAIPHPPALGVCRK